MRPAGTSPTVKAFSSTSPDLIGRQPTERTALLLAAVEPVNGKIGNARV
jgi:hypothetical protein